MSRFRVLPGLLPLGLALLIPLLAPRAGWAQGEVAPPQPAQPTRPADAARPGGEPTTREKELLERIRQLKTPRWRTFGACRVDWGGWRLVDNGVRTTQIECGEPVQKGVVAVHCDSLRMNRRFGEGAWEEWRLPRSLQDSPELGGEDLMVASLCANARPAPAAPTPPLAPAKSVGPTKPALKSPAAPTPARPKAPAPSTKPAAKPRT